MSTQKRSMVRDAGTAVGLAASGYLFYVAMTWLRFGRTRSVPAADRKRDPLLDEFMPEFDVRDRHQIEVAAPAALTLLKARRVGLDQSRTVRAIFKSRELLLGGKTAPENDRPKGLIAVTQALGWSILAEVPGREIIMGAATQPWVADTTFRPIPRNEFLSFSEPKYVKIVWTLKVEPIGPSRTILSTETRSLATDAFARKRFRVYWAVLSPGIKIIRRILLRTARNEMRRVDRLIAS